MLILIAIVKPIHYSKEATRSIELVIIFLTSFYVEFTEVILLVDYYYVKSFFNNSN